MVAISEDLTLVIGGSSSTSSSYDIGCGIETLVGNGVCDAAANNQRCNYDGGDCCSSKYVGDGLCDDFINNQECRYSRVLP